MCLCLYVCVCVCSLCSVLCLHAHVNIMNRLTNKISGNQFVLQNHEIHYTCQCRTLFMLYYPRCDCFSKEHTANTHYLFCFDFLGCMIVSCYFFLRVRHCQSVISGFSGTSISFLFFTKCLIG